MSQIGPIKRRENLLMSDDQMDGWKDGWMEGWMEGWMGIQITIGHPQEWGF